MEIATEITFHNMKPSEAIRADILKRTAKLEKFCGRLIFCRVSIEARTKQHRTGNIYEVHVEMQVPGGFLVVSREPHHVKERRAHADMRTSIVEAFAAAEEQLRSFVKKRNGGARLQAAEPVGEQVAVEEG
ncbi:MAG TPA: HPF/RaiA family ribosome-associated protein [Micropepsaceae bacterium]|nr:HPF/RaiA family ribosome-associated protein [Micropepsaceae bacterium]